MGESRAQIILFWQVWDASLFVPGANSIPLLCPADGGQAALEREGEGCKGLAEQRCRTGTTAELRLARAQHTGHRAGQGGRMSREIARTWTGTFVDCRVLGGLIGTLVQVLWDQQLGLLCLWPRQQ